MTKILSSFLALLTLITGWFSGLNFTVKYYTYKDVYYGTEERQCVDVAIPGNYKGDLGLVLFVHGGSWIHGDKSGRLSFVKNIANKYGYVAASLNYRYVSDETDCFDILDDIDAALAEIKAMCSKKGINVNKVVLYGNSAGAHLSLLYAYSRKNTAPITPAAVISLCAPTNLNKDSLFFDSNLGSPRGMARLISKVCGYPFTIDQKDTQPVIEALRKASPINYISADSVPTLIAHGELDAAIDFSNAVQLDQMLTQYGVEHDFVVYPNSGHTLANDPDVKVVRNRLIIQYFKTYLGKSALTSFDEGMTGDGSVEFPEQEENNSGPTEVETTTPETTIPETTETETTEPETTEQESITRETTEPVYN